MMPEHLVTFAAAWIALITAHHVADYLLQTDWMAANKPAPGEQPAAARCGRALSWAANQAHAGAHTLAELSALLLLAGTVGLPLHAAGVATAIALTHVTHGLIDRRWIVRWWMTHTGQSGYYASGAGAPHVDQTLHLLVLVAAAILVTVV